MKVDLLYGPQGTGHREILGSRNEHESGSPQSKPHIPLIPHKAWIAIVAVAVAITGIVTGLKWLTVAALGIWIAAILVFGRGKRNEE